MLEDSPGRIWMVFNEEGGAQWRMITKKERKKHAALNPLLRGETLSSKYTEVSLCKSLTPSVLPWKRVHR